MSSIDYHAEARKVAKKYKLPEDVFTSLVQHESGWQAQVRSPAGAIGLTQLMPGTAKSLGVDPTDPLQNLDGGARYLKQQLDRFGSIKLALAAYNAGPGAVEQYGGVPPYRETRHYVRNIMASYAPATTTTPAVKQQAQTTGPLSYRTRSPLPPPSPGDPLWGGDLVSKSAFESLGKIARGWSPTSTLEDLLAASTTAASTPSPPTTPRPPIPPPPSVPPPPPPPAPEQAVPPTSRTRKGKVILASGADRQGAATHPAVLDFVSRISGLYGKPLTIGTGTNHNQFVVNTNRQSAHWTGDAADIPSSGAALTKLGQDALIAAGMPVKEARQQQGGLFNIGDYQVIFNSMEGGNHYNHLHVGLRGDHHG